MNRIGICARSFNTRWSKYERFPAVFRPLTQKELDDVSDEDLILYRPGKGGVYHEVFDTKGATFTVDQDMNTLLEAFISGGLISDKFFGDYKIDGPSVQCNLTVAGHRYRVTSVSLFGQCEEFKTGLRLHTGTVITFLPLDTKLTAVGETIQCRGSGANFDLNFLQPFNPLCV